jgi:hypothetical protein
MPIETTAYKCKHPRCTAGLFASFANAVAHEATCTYNPENRACRTCGGVVICELSKGRINCPDYVAEG